MRVSAAVVLACLLIGGTARARDHHQHHEHTADARHHLEKANALAGEGKCAAAIKYFTLAYDKLKDPIVLFNRAECYRRIGENAKAAEDYRGFLKGFPAAPNRAEIEGRIATLEKPAAAPVRPPVGASATPPARPPSSATPSPARAAAARASACDGHAHAGGAPAEAVGPMPFLPPPPPPGSDSTTLLEAPRSPETPRAEASHGSRWWIWTTVAVVAVGGGFAAYWFLRPKAEPGPMPTLGSYRF